MLRETSFDLSQSGRSFLAGVDSADELYDPEFSWPSTSSSSMRGKSCPKLFSVEFVALRNSLDVPNGKLCLQATGLYSGTDCFIVSFLPTGVSSIVPLGGKGIGGAGPKVGDNGTLARLLPEMERLPPPDLLLLQCINSVIVTNVLNLIRRGRKILF